MRCKYPRTLYNVVETSVAVTCDGQVKRCSPSVTIRRNKNNYSTMRRITAHNYRKVIDFRSDTVTAPSRSMLESALHAQTGDDVMGEDPTVTQLQEYIASLFGKEDALFVPTGTMSNLIAIMAHCNLRSSEIIVGCRSHISLWEGGNAAGLAGTHTRQLPEDSNTAEFDLETVLTSIRSDSDDHFAKTALVCIENTHNELGGIALSPKYIQQLGDLAHKSNVQLHIDGARIWNAAIALGDLDLADYCKNADTISACLSKGLGAPLGSVLVGSKEIIRLAKRARKRCGGGMRQAGVVAAMGMYAVQNNRTRLIEDHEHAKQLAYKLQSGTDFLILRNGKIDTNIFYFRLPIQSKVLPSEFQQVLSKDYGIKISGGYGNVGDIFRIVTHLDIDCDDIERAAQAMNYIISQKS